MSKKSTKKIDSFEKLAELVVSEIDSVRSDLGDKINSVKNELRAEMKEGFGAVDRQFMAVHVQFKEVDNRLDGMNAELYHLRSEAKDIRHTLEDLEEQIGNIKGYTKEIDELYKRLKIIEKHLHLKVA